MRGPAYETPAEAEFLASRRPTVVGMSMVPESLPAQALGLRVLGFCSLTNALGEAVTHEDVLRVSNETAFCSRQAPHGPVAATVRVDRKEDRTMTNDMKDRIWRERVATDRMGRGEMPVLAQIRERFEKEQPLEGLRIAACLHVTTETANLMETLRPAAPRSRCRLQPAVDPGRRRGRALRESGIQTFAIKGEDNDTYYGHIEAVLDHQPEHDDGRRRGPGERAAHQARRPARGDPRRHRGDHHGVIRLRAMARDGVLSIPIVASTTPTRSTCSTTASDGPVDARRHHARDQLLLAGRTFVVAATACAVAAWPRGRAAWAPT